jgi:hypothetical protein
MNVPALLTVALLALVGLVAAMVQHADHLNCGPGTAAPTSGGGSGGNVLDAVVIDPLTEAELLLGRLDHGAESFAVHADIFRTDHERQRDEYARNVWNDGADWYIDNINQRFDAIVAGLPTTGEDPFDPAYWPQVSAVPTSGLPGMTGPEITLERLAAFAPEATIQIVQERNALPTYFSWHTQEQPLVRGHGDVQISQQGATTLVRERTPAKSPARRAKGRHRT